MKKFGIIGVILLAVIILVGFAVINGGNKDKAKSETVTIKNADTDKSHDDCENCPEMTEGECSGMDHSDVHLKAAETHEKGSEECEETIEAGKYPGTCPHSQATQTKKTDKI